MPKKNEVPQQPKAPPRLKLLEGFGLAEKMEAAKTIIANINQPPSLPLEEDAPIGACQRPEQESQENQKVKKPRDQKGNRKDTQKGTRKGVPFEGPLHGTVQIPFQAPFTREATLPFQAPSTDTVVPLTENEAALLICLQKVEGHPTNLVQISLALKVSQNTLKKCMNRLVQKGVVVREGKCRVGRHNAFRASVNPVRVVLGDPSKRLVKVAQDLHPQFLLLHEDLSVYPSGDPPKHPSSYPPLNTEEEDNIIYTNLLQPEVEGNWKGTAYPKIAEIGLSQEHLMKIVKAWKRDKIPLELLPVSLERAEYALEHNSKIEKPLDYVYSVLLRGTFAKPQGFKSRAELAMEEMKREADAIRAREEEYFEDAFLVWWDRLAEQGRVEVDTSNKTALKTPGILEMHRQEWFREKVFTPLG